MIHLVVVTHPVEDRFTMCLMRAYTTELEKISHSQRTRDLYHMGFDPLLGVQERVSDSGANAVQAQDDIRATYALTVIHPLLLLPMLAMMEGYIDWIFSRGCAYEFDKGAVRGGLTGKKAVSGVPLPLLVKTGNWNALQALQDTHALRSAGFELLKPLHFDEVVSNSEYAMGEQHMAQVRSCAHQIFSSI
jgi:NAD(P)H dehydrogenase (quinone)